MGSGLWGLYIMLFHATRIDTLESVGLVHEISFLQKH